MTNVYIFQAALYCEDCGKAICARTPKPPHLDPDDESSWDSDDYPKGPYSDGGGEADTPQHCDACHEFLENPLTPDGYAWLAEQDSSPPVRRWRKFYREGAR